MWINGQAERWKIEKVKTIDQQTQDVSKDREELKSLAWVETFHLRPDVKQTLSISLCFSCCYLMYHTFHRWKSKKNKTSHLKWLWAAKRVNLQFKIVQRQSTKWTKGKSSWQREYFWGRSTLCLKDGYNWHQENLFSSLCFLILEQLVPASLEASWICL